MVRALFIIALLVAAPSSAASVVYAGPAWAAIDRGATCEALSRSMRVAAKGKVQAIAGFTFSADRRRWGEFHTRLRRMPRAGAAVMLRIDDQPFLLVSRGNWAWSRGPAQDQAIIAIDHRLFDLRKDKADRTLTVAHRVSARSDLGKAVFPRRHEQFLLCVRRFGPGGAIDRQQCTQVGLVVACARRQSAHAGARLPQYFQIVFIRHRLLSRAHRQCHCADRDGYSGLLRNRGVMP